MPVCISHPSATALAQPGTLQRRGMRRQRGTRVLLLTLSMLLPTSCDAGSDRRSGFFQQMVGGDAADVRTFFQQHFERLPMLKRFSDRCALRSSACHSPCVPALASMQRPAGRC
jgi:hypothetical protein